MSTANSATDASIAPSPTQGKSIDWIILVAIVTTHLMAVVGVFYLIFGNFSWATLALGATWGVLCFLSVTGGYHRLFSHRTYNCIKPLRLFYLLFGAASLQHTALNWCADHRRHHASTDEELDPYNIGKGFWWAHIGWLFYVDDDRNHRNVQDLAADPLVRFQHQYYVPLAIFMGFILPMGIAALWGDALGGLFVAGFIRLALQYQATFSVNSFAHYIGTQPYSISNSARDSVLVALITMGEGYHNYHHRFPTDYRNGIKAYHFDPVKWWVWALSKVGVTSNLRRVPREVIQKAIEDTRMEIAAGAKKLQQIGNQ